MNRRNAIPLLLILAIISVGYAIYRSLAYKVTVVVNNQQQVYGEAQHGLLLGLCVFAGACLIAMALLLDKTDVIATTRGERHETPRRILS